jgi:hypothetical protein
MGLSKPIQINIYLNDGTVAKNPAATPRIEPKKVVDKDVEIGAALDVRFGNRDTLNETEAMELDQEAALYVRRLLKQKKMEVLRKFLSDAKHHLSTNARDLISEEVKLSAVKI